MPETFTGSSARRSAAEAQRAKAGSFMRAQLNARFSHAGKGRGLYAGEKTYPSAKMNAAVSTTTATDSIPLATWRSLQCEWLWVYHGIAPRSVAWSSEIH